MPERGLSGAGAVSKRGLAARPVIDFLRRPEHHLAIVWVLGRSDMNRRSFLIGTAAVAGLGLAGRVQGQQAPSGQPGAPAGRGRVGGRGQGHAAVAPEKLARIAIMSLDHGSILKLPWNTAPTENQTLDLMDLPKY